MIEREENNASVAKSTSSDSSDLIDSAKLHFTM